MIPTALCVYGTPARYAVVSDELAAAVAYEETTRPVPYRWYDNGILQLTLEDSADRERALAYIEAARPTKLVVRAEHDADDEVWVLPLLHLGYTVYEARDQHIAALRSLLADVL